MPQGARGCAQPPATTRTPVRTPAQRGNRPGRFSDRVKIGYESGSTYCAAPTDLEIVEVRLSPSHIKHWVRGLVTLRKCGSGSLVHMGSDFSECRRDSFAAMLGPWPTGQLCSLPAIGLIVLDDPSQEHDDLDWRGDDRSGW
jgi:hypothetical protein